MSAEEIDGYLASVEEPKRSTLEALRQSILEVVPDAEQCISYGMPAFKVQGKTVAGFAAFTGRAPSVSDGCELLDGFGRKIWLKPSLDHFLPRGRIQVGGISGVFRHGEATANLACQAFFSATVEEERVQAR